MPNAPFIPTIGYVRSLKITRLSVTCEGKRPGGWTCYHHSILPIAEKTPDGVTLDSISRRLRCERCGTLGATDVRPDWSELHKPMTGRGAPWMVPPSPNPERRGSAGVGGATTTGGQDGGRSQQTRPAGPGADQYE